MKNYAIILASGSGTRIGSDIPKQFSLISDRTIIEHSIDIFENCDLIDKIILVVNPNFLNEFDKILSRNNYKKVENILKGGATRQISSFIGINSIKDREAKVLIHDGVRPFVSKTTIAECIFALDKYNAVNVAIESSDTIIEVDENNIIKSVPDRKFLRRCQTPQGFLLSIIKKAHELAKTDGVDSITDDCGLILKYNLSEIFVVKGSTSNIKITYPIDLEIAKLIVKKESH